MVTEIKTTNKAKAYPSKQSTKINNNNNKIMTDKQHYDARQLRVLAGNAEEEEEEGG